MEGGRKKNECGRTVSSSHTAPYSGPPKTDTESMSKKADRSRV